MKHLQTTNITTETLEIVPEKPPEQNLHPNFFMDQLPSSKIILTNVKYSGEGSHSRGSKIIEDKRKVEEGQQKKSKMHLKAAEVMEKLRKDPLVGAAVEKMEAKRRSKRKEKTEEPKKEEVKLEEVKLEEVFKPRKHEHYTTHKNALEGLRRSVEDYNKKFPDMAAKENKSDKPANADDFKLDKNKLLSFCKKNDAGQKDTAVKEVKRLKAVPKRATGEENIDPFGNGTTTQVKLDTITKRAPPKKAKPRKSTKPKEVTYPAEEAKNETSLATTENKSPTDCLFNEKAKMLQQKSQSETPTSKTFKGMKIFQSRIDELSSVLLKGLNGNKKEAEKAPKEEPKPVEKSPEDENLQQVFTPRKHESYTTHEGEEYQSKVKEAVKQAMSSFVFKKVDVSKPEKPKPMRQQPVKKPSKKSLEVERKKVKALPEPKGYRVNPHISAGRLLSK